MIRCARRRSIRWPPAPTVAASSISRPALLIAIVLAGGLLFYNPTAAPGERNDQARQPDRPSEPIIEAPGTPPRPTIPRQ